MSETTSQIPNSQGPTTEWMAPAEGIPASNVRSSLAELETQTTQILSRLEYVKVTLEHHQQQQNLSLQDLPVTSNSLQPDKKPTTEVLTNLEVLISQLDVDDESEFILPPLDNSSQLAIISHSISAYLTAMDRQHLARVVSKIVIDTNCWLSHLFRFTDCNTSYYRDCTECILHAVRLAICNRFPESMEKRLAQLQSATLYISETSSLFALQNTCRFIGLPVGNIRIISCNTNENHGSMDTTELQKILTLDVESGKFPLFLIAELGSSIGGEVDNLAIIRNICNDNDIWLHCQGDSLAALAVTKGQLTGVLIPVMQMCSNLYFRFRVILFSQVKAIPDSMTLNVGHWLGLTGVPCVLMHRQIPVNYLSLFDVDPILSNRLVALNLWTVMQSMGVNSISERIFMAFDSCRHVHEVLSKIKGIKILSKTPRQEAGKSFRAQLNNPINYFVLFETAVPVVVFQFDGSVDEDDGIQATVAAGDISEIPESVTAENKKSFSRETSEVSNSKSVEKNFNPSYYDRLNGWLGQILLRDCVQLNMEIMNHPLHGTCIRYSPFTTGYGELPLSEMIENVAQFIEAQIEILTATVKHKARFNLLVGQSSVLRLIELNDWAGLGSVHYVPEGWETLLTDQAKTELNRLNSALVDMLKAHDGAFSLGEANDGLICVRFGMVTRETDVEELLDLVIQTGQKIQENSKILDTMSEILKKGIEAATIDLQREAEEKLWQDGILRQVPLVGRVVNWWSPPAREGGVKGRSLNLTQGVVESTENIYKYHMQMTAKTNQLPGNKNPPTPLVQTPISADGKSLHSRNGSSSSQYSNSAVILTTTAEESATMQ